MLPVIPLKVLLYGLFLDSLQIEWSSLPYLDLSVSQAEALVSFANRCAIRLSEAPSSVASRLASNYVLHPSSANADHRWPRHMAWAEGFEPPTVGLESMLYQLSYAHVYCRRCWFVRFWQVNLSYDPSGVYCSLALIALKGPSKANDSTATHKEPEQRLSGLFGIG